MQGPRQANNFVNNTSYSSTDAKAVVVVLHSPLVLVAGQQGVSDLNVLLVEQATGAANEA
jgi:hypothetical protein